LPEHPINSERVYTLDLDQVEGVDFQGTDIHLAKEALNYQRKYLLSANKHLVKQILLNSLDLDESQYYKKFQFIFIDANHEVNYVKSDTEKSFKMISESPACIVWHDYGNHEFPELTQYIDDLATTMPVYHIEDTMLAFHLIGIDVVPRNNI